MKIRTLLLGTVLGLTLAGSAQATPFHGWYVGLEGGADWVQKDKFVNHFTGGGPSIFNEQFSFKTGWAVLASVGYAFDRHWRIEGEAGYRANDLDRLKVFNPPPISGPVHGDLREMTLMANVLYDIPLGSRLDLSIGVGAGGDDARLKVTPSFSQSTWDFAYQGIAGLNYSLGQRSQLFVDYRYLTDTGPKLNSGPNHLSFDDLHKHTVTIGLRYDLTADEEMAPAPAAAAPPLPAAAPAHFIVFFGFNKCNITAEADSVLSEAASAAKNMGSASVTIVGHTDTVGSNKYNQKLSECRAHAAESNLVGKGVPKGAISASGKGETELMVQTGDGVKEPQNRRATVDLH